MKSSTLLPQSELTELPKPKFSPDLKELAGHYKLDTGLLEKREPVDGFTVDGESSRDLDDAIWLKESPSGYQVIVSITDVDYLVKVASPLDLEALNRATTIYYPSRNIPMFPRVLSENLLSLREKEERPTLSVYIDLDKNLQIVHVDIRETYLKSAKRLSHNNFHPNLKIAENKLRLFDYINLAKGLNERRGTEQSLAYQHFERGFSTTEEGELIEQLPTHGHLVVQEFMILANRAMAKYFQDNQKPALYRNHLPLNGHAPTRADLIALIEQNSDYLQLIDRVREVYQTYLSAASYSEQPLGHVGLNLPRYLHFTSPIRRYGDLINHRLAKAIKQQVEPPYNLQDVSEIASYLNARLRRIATLRSSQHLPNALSIYRQNYSLLNPKNKISSTEPLQKLQQFLSAHRLGNVHFDFRFGQGINVKLFCKAWVRYQKQRFEVSMSAYADKTTIKNIVSNRLFRKLKLLLETSPELFSNHPERVPKEDQESSSPAQILTAKLYQYCQENGLNRPQFHYENWDGRSVYENHNARFSCFCQLSEIVTVIGYGLSKETSKQDSIQKMLNYLTTQTKSIPPQAYSNIPPMIIMPIPKKD